MHATIGTTQQKKEQLDISIVPGFVYNHGILNNSQLQQLLKVSHQEVLIGKNPRVFIVRGTSQEASTHPLNSTGRVLVGSICALPNVGIELYSLKKVNIIWELVSFIETG